MFVRKYGIRVNIYCRKLFNLKYCVPKAFYCHSVLINFLGISSYKMSAVLLIKCQILQFNITSVETGGIYHYESSKGTFIKRI